MTWETVHTKCTTVYRRGEQVLRENTIDFVKERWVVFALLLSLLLHRTLFYLHGFYVVIYALFIVFITKVSIYYNPLNEILAPIQNNNQANISHHQDNGDNLEQPLLAAPLPPPRPRKRLSEYQLWFDCCFGVVVAGLLSFIPWLDVPVYVPILLGFIVLLALFEGIQSIRRRWEVAAAHDERPSATGTSRNVVEIRLVRRSQLAPHFIAIRSITPWNAARQPPPFLHSTMSPEVWQSFLRDVELGMESDGNETKRALAFVGIFGILCYVGNASLYHLVRHVPHYFSCSASSPCLREIVMFCLPFVPAIVYYIISFRRLLARSKQELTRLSEKVQRVCDDLQGRHPHLQCRAKVQNGRFVLVQVQHHATQV